jgi:hypothetical protein
VASRSHNPGHNAAVGLCVASTAHLAAQDSAAIYSVLSIDTLPRSRVRRCAMLSVRSVSCDHL